MYQVEVKNLYKVFGPHPKKVFSLLEKGLSKEEILVKTGNTIGVNDVSFKVKKGEFFVVMGLSGSGKSTLIRCLNRLIEPTSGEVLIDGDSIIKAEKDKLLEMRRKKIAMVFQKFGLFPHRSVLDNVEYGLEVQGVDEKARRKKAYEALELVGLKGYEKQMPHELSGGMQQRVGLARALATDPDILLMDEAFSALDPLIRTEMQEELLELQSRMHKTIIFITHDLDEALKLGDRIAVMKDGQVVQIGTPEGILTNPANEYVRDFVKDVNRSKVVSASSVMIKPDALVTTKDGPRVALKRMNEQKISSVYVTDKNRKLKGIVNVDDVAEMIKQKKTSLEEILVTDVPTTSPDTPIIDLMHLATDSQYPIAVIDDNNKLLGIIVRASLISGIVGEED
ncbi:quaternary amine ABC transporter ATP-binding protein [Caldisalinibacter kiritimatiensis]|uniref:Quaternary amine transport ATP-binding protein n=1 Tax=Caldisalinibacter kiritimatiensis TaxID=1304284 RepID=R1CFV2_9FIRM|nr:glycine betaine/L-proline ABC transporter ATP-binding protein [Caldisalinibacter kiritimatiensis]EOD01190.1 Glycine betaine/L-proline transport ATP-binding subunit [Caldisalinibacter kiritimatiensis]